MLQQNIDSSLIYWIRSGLEARQQQSATQFGAFYGTKRGNKTKTSLTVRHYHCFETTYFSHKI